MQGWTGKILNIDLSTRAIHAYALDENVARLFLDGRGLGARLLWDAVGPRVEPLSPENVLIFAVGPLMATGYQTSSRFSVSTKSPLTGTILDANSGGYWGIQFKRAGYDALVVNGRADQPVYIEVGPQGVEIHDAQRLWDNGCSRRRWPWDKTRKPAAFCASVQPAKISAASRRS